MSDETTAGAGRPHAVRTTGDSETTRPTGAGPNRSTGDMHSGEGASMRDLDVEAAAALPAGLAALRDRVAAAVDGLEPVVFRGELTLLTPPERLVETLRFCRDEVGFALLADLSGVHWPGGRRRESAQETTGWPTYEFGSEQGHVEVDYLLLSPRDGHRLRLRVTVPDSDPALPSATVVYRSANVMEREVYDLFGVRFEGHPNLTRILMPDTWDGHPLRKDYPLGGVDVRYHGATVPPPDERHY
ncbi:MAG: NADH-quinone oxidoreductase subunit C [Actinomycetota bacterium]|nr:NADH-quinone oxidoreductase subunit C [Actinomycetota bacterium]